MYHLAAYHASIATATEAVLTPVTDQILTVQSNGFLPMGTMQLHAAMALGATINYAYLQSPLMRALTPPFIRPVQAGATWPSFGQPADFRNTPFLVRKDEPLSVYAYQTSGVGEDEYAAVCLAKDFRNAPIGDIYTMHGSSTTAAVANAWTTLTTTWDSTLPQGRYAVVGFELVGAASVFARLILENQSLRPGSICGASLSTQLPSMFRKGRMGLWGEFSSVFYPQIEVLATAATASWDAYLDIIKIA